MCGCDLPSVVPKLGPRQKGSKKYLGGHRAPPLNKIMYISFRFCHFSCEIQDTFISSASKNNIGKGKKSLYG